jgi:hypothetical protein
MRSAPVGVWCTTLTAQPDILLCTYVLFVQAPDDLSLIVSETFHPFAHALQHLALNF